jgi:hypothetical protein
VVSFTLRLLYLRDKSQQHQLSKCLDWLQIQFGSYGADINYLCYRQSNYDSLYFQPVVYSLYQLSYPGSLFSIQSKLDTDHWKVGSSATQFVLKDGNLYPAYVTPYYIQTFHRRLDDKTPALIIQSNPLHRRVEEVVNIHGALRDRTTQLVYESA